MASIDKQMQLLGSQARAAAELLLFRRLNSGPWPFQRVRSLSQIKST